MVMMKMRTLRSLSDRDVATYGSPAGEVPRDRLTNLSSTEYQTGKPKDLLSRHQLNYFPQPTRTKSSLQIRNPKKQSSVMGCELSRQLSEPCG